MHLDSATYAILKDIHCLMLSVRPNSPIMSPTSIILPPYSERNHSSQRKRLPMSNIARYTQRKDKSCLFLLRSQDHHKTKDKVGVMWVVPKYYDYLQAPPVGPYAEPVKPIPYSHFFFGFLWLLLIITCFPRLCSASNEQNLCKPEAVNRILYHFITFTWRTASRYPTYEIFPYRRSKAASCKYRVIQNDCRGHTQYTPDATPCDFFLWGYVKDQIYVPPLPASIPELNVRIRTATETITADMRNELDYRVDVCRITKDAHIEHL